METIKILQELIDSIDEYEKTLPKVKNCRCEACSPEELKRYWKAYDRAKCHIALINGVDDDLAVSNQDGRL